MECPDFEPLIFTYAELSAEERSQLDLHLQGCSHCRALLAQASQMQHLVSQVAEQKPLPPHAARLTGQIMAAIPPRQPRWWQSVEDFLQNGLTKFSLTTVSAGLVLLLAIEWWPEASLNTSFGQPAKRPILLDAKRFRESLAKVRSKATPASDCKSPFKPASYTLACLKSKLK